MVQLDEFKTALGAYETPLKEVRDSLGLETKKLRIEELERNMEAPDFWENADKASADMKEVKDLKSIVDNADGLQTSYDDILTLIEMAYEEEDEPTVAVDPQSRNNILDGIKKLRDNGATIVYTTHYMEEVEILCDRIIILDKGKILATGTSDELKELAKIEEKVTIEVNNLSPKYIDEIKKLENVDEVTYNSNLLLVTYKKGKNNLVSIMEYLKKEDIKYNKIYSERPTLNDVFLELTGKELRD